MAKVHNAKLSEFQPDPHNANKGTQRGRGMLEHSLTKLGAGRSIVVDRNNVTIGGAKTLETAVESGFEDAIVVETDGSQLVVVRRTDLDMATDARAKELAIADNRVGQTSLDWDIEVLAELQDEGVDLGQFWMEAELDRMFGESVEVQNPEDLWQGMPEFENEDSSAPYFIKVNFYTTDAIEKFAALVGQVVTEKTKSINYPEIPREDLKKYRVKDEP